jgi:hypothetical protein
MESLHATNGRLLDHSERSEHSMFWLSSLPYDLIFLTPFWFVIAYLSVGHQLEAFLGTSAFLVWFYHLFIRLPHFVAGYRFTYFKEASWISAREKPISLILIPAMIFGVYLLPFLLGYSSQHPFVHATILAASIFGTYHIGMQNLGILQLYRRREAEVLGTVSPLQLEKLVFYTAILINIESTALKTWRDSSFVQGLEILLRIVLGAALVYYCFKRGKPTPSGRRLTAGDLHLFLAVAVMFPWSFYGSSLDHFLLYNGHHSIAYLGLLFLVREPGRKPSDPSRSRPLAVFWRFVVYTAPLVLVSFGLIWLGKYTSPYNTSSHNPITSQVILGFFMVHYYLESVIWRSSGRQVLQKLDEVRTLSTGGTCALSPGM